MNLRTNHKLQVLVGFVGLVALCAVIADLIPLPGPTEQSGTVAIFIFGGESNLPAVLDTYGYPKVNCVGSSLPQIKPGDSILKIDNRGTKGATASVINNQLLQGKVGSSVRLTVLHRQSSAQDQISLVVTRQNFNAVQAEFATACRAPQAVWK